MHSTIIALMLLIFPVIEDDDVKQFIADVEQVEYKIGDRIKPRVIRNEQGEVTRLFLADMSLSKKQFQTLACIETLELLSLRNTNVQDEDLARLVSLENLKSLHLTSTHVTDFGFKHVSKLKSLRSICMAHVRITPAAVAKLKQEFKDKGRKIGIGYSQIKEE